ncbi:MAG TPA: hypothetical protein VD815_07585 [Candidatus Saccharimonadales bacterium]|nr:hypothetical protein [Candidatus Saccharimonadales bacterium]
MSISSLFIIYITIATAILGVGSLATLIQAQTPTTSDLPMTTINETNSNSTVAVLNKTLPAENATDVIPVVPM